MAITVVQTSSAAVPAFGSSANATFGSTPTVGNKLIAIGGNRDAGGTVSVAGHTLVRNEDAAGSWPDAWLWYRDVVGGDGVNYSVSNSTRSRVVIIEVSGLASGTAAAQNGNIGFGSGAGAVAAPALTSQGFIVAAINPRNAASVSSTDNGFSPITGAGRVDGGLTPFCSGCYKIASGSQTAQQTFNDRANTATAVATWAAAPEAIILGLLDASPALYAPTLTATGGGARSQGMII